MTAPNPNDKDRRHSAMTTNADTPDPMQEAVTAATEALFARFNHGRYDDAEEFREEAEAAVAAAAPHIEAEVRRRVAEDIRAAEDDMYDGSPDQRADAARAVAFEVAARIAAGQTEGDDRG